MWLLTPLGFFSIVQKPEDASAGTLTVRARVREDLENLRAVVPEMGPTVEGAGMDYAYRAQAPAKVLGRAIGALVSGIDYRNFKEEVGARQGLGRVRAYAKVWSFLKDLSDDGDAA